MMRLDLMSTGHSPRIFRLVVKAVLAIGLGRQI